MTNILIFIGKIVSAISKLLNKGSGSTWPGHIALSAKHNFIYDIIRSNPQLKIILVVGTNGKTTTSKLIASILEEDGKKILQNTSGANLLNGIASSFILSAHLNGRLSADYAIFEVDENNLPLVLQQITPTAIVALNLFRDQLDRYGELDNIAKKWKIAFENFVISNGERDPHGIYPKGTSYSVAASPHDARRNDIKFILNADDPLIAWLGFLSSQASVNERGDLKKSEIAASSQSYNGTPRNDVSYFGLAEAQMKQKTLHHGADSIYCPRCGEKLIYSKVSYSHLGNWHCKKCGLKRPKLGIKNQELRIKSQLDGVYNEYNMQAAIVTTQALGVSDSAIKKGLESVQPAFGRQEIIEKDGKYVQIFLSKNPTSFNESLATITNLKADHVLFVLNDRIPDGRDVSWIWDIDLEQYVEKFKQIIVSGDRVYDLSLRMHYAQEISNKNSKLQIFENLNEAIEVGLQTINKGETLYILPTYSAMLEVRENLTGKKIS